MPRERSAYCVPIAPLSGGARMHQMISDVYFIHDRRSGITEIRGLQDGLMPLGLQSVTQEPPGELLGVEA